MNSVNPQTDSPRSAIRASWRWPITLMVIALSLLLALLYVFKSCRELPGDTLARAGKLVDRAGESARKVAAAFSRGTITTTFTSYATTLSGGQCLQFASLSQTEVFTRKDESSLAFGWVPLPDLIVQASAPVTYTYYLDLNDRWDFRLEGGVIHVVAPLIQFNKPAVDASRIVYEIKKDSLLRNSTAALSNLKESITSLSYLKARSNIHLVRETGRNQVQTFVQHWLAKSFSDGKAFAVEVEFRDEAKSLATPADGLKVIP